MNPETKARKAWLAFIRKNPSVGIGGRDVFEIGYLTGAMEAHAEAAKDFADASKKLNRRKASKP